MSQELNLPKPYLSYSAWDLWKRDKNAYRARYYEGEPYISTPYTEFGNLVGGILETGDYELGRKIVPGGEHIEKVPRYSEPEKKIEVEILGVPFLMYLDSFCPDTLSILEYKTGIVNKKTGKAPWDLRKVHNHLQLDVYSLGIRELYGNYNPLVKLAWLETKWSTIQVEREFTNRTFVETCIGLKLTGGGKYDPPFERTIESWELDKVAQDIRKDALEISEDYTQWKILQEKGIPF